MKLPIYQVDAFTSRLFGGNPAAVVPLDAWLPDAVMQAIAAENNLSETAFVIPQAGVSPLRWFTPEIEVDLCGHATLATGHVLFAHYFPEATRLDFETHSGIVSVQSKNDLLYLDFPAWPTEPAAITELLTQALGARPREAWLNRDLLAIFDSEDEIRKIKPDMTLLSQIEVLGVMVSAPGNEVDFVSRFFGPRAGIPEDPVTGSAHCTLAPYWAERLGKTSLRARQLSSRLGELNCELHGKRVLIGGRTVEYLRGEINLPDA